MNVIQTENFKLAIYSKGDENSPKLVLVLPGRLDTKDYPHMKSHVDFLASKGFFALSFDPPGTWESGDDLNLYTTTNYIKAVEEILSYYHKDFNLVVGHSRGGSVAMFAALKNNNINAFVSIMSSYSFHPDVAGGYPDENWKQHGFNLSIRDVPNSSELREFNLPYNFLQDQIQYDALEDLKNCLKPKMFIYGSKDETVEPEIVEYAFKNSAEPKIMFELESDHDYRFNPIVISKINDCLGNFVDIYLK